jgi:hypothetical protein
MFISITALALAAASPFAPPLGASPPITGERTRLLNLGSPHLSEFATMQPNMLEPLLANLARFRPTIITIENVGGEQCDMMKRAPKYKDAVQSYCVDPTAAQKATGLTQQQAETASEATFDRWAMPGAAAPTPSDRRKLALIALAANERGTAWVQWLRLAPADRIAADGIDAETVKSLNREGKQLNESYNLAAVLAARLGLERIYAVDDHTSDGALLHAGKEYNDALTARWSGFRTDPLFLAYQERSKGVTDGASLLGFYRYLNAPATLSAQIRGDFGGALTRKPHLMAVNMRHGGRSAICAWRPISAPRWPSIRVRACSTSSARRIGPGTMAGCARCPTST